MTLFKVKKGRNLKIEGQPTSDIQPAGASERFALLPPEFEGLKLKLEVKVGDPVKVGSPLLSNRANPDMLFTSPAGGTVSAINRGARRKLLEIVVEADKEEAYESFESFAATDIAKSDKQKLISILLKSGLWPFIIQRPFSRVANPEANPKSIFVNAMDTEPNCADKQLLIKDQDKELQAGLDALTVLTSGTVYLNSDASVQPEVSAIANAKNVDKNQFSGPHPAGCVGTHIHLLDPINKGDAVWHITAEHTALIGKLLLTGQVPIYRTIALSGSGVNNPKYYTTRAGASLDSILKPHIEKGEMRVINGGVLTGKTIPASSYLGFYNSTVTVIPEGGPKEVLGWVKPGLYKPSFGRMFLSALLPGKIWEMDTKVGGERRAIVATHVYDPLVALGVHTSFLVKSCIAGDVESMEELGLLECAPEDFALCTYACVSKVEVDSIIKEGLELLEKES